MIGVEIKQRLVILTLLLLMILLIILILVMIVIVWDRTETGQRDSKIYPEEE